MAAPDFAFDKAAFTAWCEAQCDNKDWRRDMTLKMLPLLVKELLTEKQRAYVVSYFYHGKTVEQIVVEFGVNKSTVSRSIHRGLDRMWKVLRYNYPEFKIIYKKSGYLSNR